MAAENLLRNDKINYPNKDWQDGFRALLPNINVSFGSLPANYHQNLQANPSDQQQQKFPPSVNERMQHHQQQQQQQQHHRSGMEQAYY